MDKQAVTTSASPRVLITAQGDLAIKGTDELEVVARTDSPEELTLTQAGDEVRVDSSTDCMVRVPRQALVTIEEAHGDASIKAVEGALTIEGVSGSLELRSVGPVRIERVEGNLVAKHIAGPVTIGTVGGNAIVKDVEGPLSVTGRVGGNLKLDDLEDNASGEASGNLTLRLDPQPGQSYRFKAGGNVLCRLSSDSSVEVDIQQAARVVVNLSGDVKITHVEEGIGPTHLIVEEGDAQMSLSAGGSIVLISQADDWEMAGAFDSDMGVKFEGMAEGLSEQITQQVEAQLGLLEKQLEEQLRHLNLTLGTAGISKEASERISQRAREASARATVRAQEKMQRAQERIKRNMETAQRKAEQRARRAERHAERQAQRSERRSWAFEWPASPITPEAPESSVSDEERLIILRMLQEKKITPEEAEKLLSALEGSGE